MSVVGTCIPGLMFFTLLRAQSVNDQRFNELVNHAKSIQDSLPKEAKGQYLLAWKIGKNQDPKKKAWLLNEIGFLYHVEGNNDSSLFFYRQGLSTSIAASYPIEEVGAYKGIAIHFIDLSIKDSAHIYLEKGTSVAEEYKLYTEEAGLYVELGNVYLAENNLKDALSHYIKAANLYDSLSNDGRGLSLALSNIANTHYRLGNFDKALEYIEQANPIAKENSSYRIITYNYKLAGRIYRQKKMPERALQQYRLAWASYQQAGEKYSMSEVSLGIGNLYYDLNDFGKALTEYKKGLAIAKEISAKSLIAHNYSAIGFAFYSLKQWKNATAYMDSTRILASEIKRADLIMDAYDVLADIEREQHRYENALNYKDKYIGIKDSLTAAENRSTIEEMEAKYQNETKSAAIELLKKDQEIQAAALQRNKIIIAGGIVTFLAAIIITVLLLNRFRLLNRTKRQMEMERMRNQIARDLHDDIGSTLSSINIISQLALKDGKGEKSTAPHFQRIHDHSARVMENMSDIVWSIHPGNDSMEKVIVKMKEFCGEILEPKDIAYSFENVELLSGVSLDIESRKNLFLIFKEIINNAAKYSQATQINIVFHKNHKGWRMDIADNGKGFDQLTAKKGNGLINIRKRAEAMNAAINLKTNPGEGTTIAMEAKDIT